MRGEGGERKRYLSSLCPLVSQDLQGFLSFLQVLVLQAHHPVHPLHQPRPALEDPRDQAYPCFLGPQGSRQCQQDQGVPVGGGQVHVVI